MRRTYSTVPQSMSDMTTYGFSWMDFLTAIPSPLFVATTYKDNGMANACLQSWSAFSGDETGFRAILTNVNRDGHFYSSIHNTGEAVLNFPSTDIYDKCLATIENNAYEKDEIASSGLTATRAQLVNAPLIVECFLCLECRLLWEHEASAGSRHSVLCLEVLAVSAREEKLDEGREGRYGKTGYLYNIHHPIDPVSFSGKAHDWLGTIEKIRDMGEY